MKKSIASLALAASASAALASSAHALPMPLPPGTPLPPPAPTYTYCLADYGKDGADNAQYVGDCDEKEKNTLYGAPIGASGCAEGQVVIHSTHRIAFRSCSTAVQL